MSSISIIIPFMVYVNNYFLIRFYWEVLPESKLPPLGEVARRGDRGNCMYSLCCSMKIEPVLRARQLKDLFRSFGAPSPGMPRQDFDGCIPRRHRRMAVRGLRRGFHDPVRRQLPRHQDPVRRALAGHRVTSKNAATRMNGCIFILHQCVVSLRNASSVMPARLAASFIVMTPS